MELSRKDSRLLFELDQDSRRSNLSIAKALGISKNTVAARIERFQKLGVIKDFYTVIDAGKLGYRGVRVYVKLRQCPPKRREEILNYFDKSPVMWWVGSIEGEFDLGVVAWIKELAEFESLWKGFEKKFHKYLARACVSLFTGIYDGTVGFLEPSKERGVCYVGTYSKTDVDKNELGVLGVLSDDARARTVSVASKLGLSPLTVQHCIRRLKKKGIIKGFRVRLDLPLLGYTFYKINFQIFDIGARQKMLSHALACPNVLYIDETIGFADLEVEAVFRTHTEFREFLDDFLKRFSKDIVDYNYFIYLKVHKIKHSV
jgi:DNA-binding Lrp family transcriptional regulator